VCSSSLDLVGVAGYASRSPSPRISAGGHLRSPPKSITTAIAGRHHEADVLDQQHGHVALVGEPPDELPDRRSPSSSPAAGSSSITTDGPDATVRDAESRAAVRQLLRVRSSSGRLELVHRKDQVDGSLWWPGQSQ
jgi:hypothetical protein